MSLFEKFKSAIETYKKNEVDVESKTRRRDDMNYQKMFDQIISDAKSILNNDKLKEEKVHPIFSYIKLFTDFVTYDVAINSFNERKSNATDLFKIFNNNKDCKQILTLFEIESDKDFYDTKEFYGIKEYIRFNFSSTPIIINPWHSERIATNIQDRETLNNPFDCSKYSSNIQNYYVYPLGFVISCGGNHSQLAAKIKGNSQSIVRIVYDCTGMYAKVTKAEKEKELKTVDNVYSFINIVLFEIGRLLLNHPDIFPENIQTAITQYKQLGV